MPGKIWYSTGRGLLNALPQTNWHSWFAWFPVKLTHGKNSGNWVWWKTISRKIKIRIYDDKCYYRLKEQENAE